MSYLCGLMSHLIEFSRYHFQIVGKTVFKPVCLIGLLCIFLGLIGGTAYGTTTVIPQIPPMPGKYKNFQIADPDPSLPSEFNAFLGEWPEGVWKYSESVDLEIPISRNHRVKLIVLSVSADSAEVIYGISSSPDSAFLGAWTKAKAEITDCKGRKCLLLMPDSGHAIRFWVEGGKTLKGRQLRNFELEVSRGMGKPRNALPAERARCLEMTVLRLLLIQSRFGN
jgi:hypothetical protein